MPPRDRGTRDGPSLPVLGRRSRPSAPAVSRSPARTQGPKSRCPQATRVTVPPELAPSGAHRAQADPRLLATTRARRTAGRRLHSPISAMPVRGEREAVPGEDVTMPVGVLCSQALAQQTQLCHALITFTSSAREGCTNSQAPAASLGGIRRSLPGRSCGRSRADTAAGAGSPCQERRAGAPRAASPQRRGCPRVASCSGRPG